MKMEGEGEKPIEGIARNIRVFASRNALFTAQDREDPAFVACDNRLRHEVEEALRRDKGSTHYTWSGGSSMEISKERLLELAEQARTRDQMAAGREPLESV